MIERKVPKDIRIYKTKLLGPLTLRQIVCVGIIIVLDALLYTVAVETFHLSIDSLLYIIIPVDIIVGAFTREVAGLPMEKYLQKVLIPNFVNPKNRKVKKRLIIVEPPKLSDKEKDALDKEHKKIIKSDPNMKAFK